MKTSFRFRFRFRFQPFEGAFIFLMKAASGIRVGGDNASETTNRQGFQGTSVGSPGSQFLYEKDAPLEAKMDEDVSE